MAVRVPSARLIIGLLLLGFRLGCEPLQRLGGAASGEPIRHVAFLREIRQPQDAN
jgi:hypothetical protein